MKRSITAQAATFAEDARHGYATARETHAAIVAKFTAILTKRAELATEAEALGTGDALAADIAALDALFLAICRALDAEGLTLSGGEISALKRQGMPGQLAAELDALKAGKIAALPAAERLEEKTARRLYTALTSAGLISGPWGTFAYYLAQQPTPAAKRPEKPLSWDGKDAELAYFIDRFPRKRKRPYTRALCLAFGKTDREIINVVQSARTHPDEAKGTDQIDIIFNSL